MNWVAEGINSSSNQTHVHLPQKLTPSSFGALRLWVVMPNYNEPLWFKRVSPLCIVFFITVLIVPVVVGEHGIHDLELDGEEIPEPEHQREGHEARKPIWVFVWVVFGIVAFLFILITCKRECCGEEEETTNSAPYIAVSTSTSNREFHHIGPGFHTTTHHSNTTNNGGVFTTTTYFTTSDTGSGSPTLHTHRNPTPSPRPTPRPSSPYGFNQSSEGQPRPESRRPMPSAPPFINTTSVDSDDLPPCYEEAVCSGPPSPNPSRSNP